ncbi:MAG: FMN-binding negative transcriptional regulator [Phycisphaeraceae bacterium]|nr:FMN-binding negative transcriptional regulator [Phycisphaerales bacterium]MCB9843130.1 FMN-binding negative transcriptional regulator [Phycisphaeraceae bacterium]
MYTRPTNRPGNHDTFARRVMLEYPFGVIVVSSGERLLHASHIPLLVVSADGEPVRLAGHLARANELWKHLADAPEVLCVFSGPHAFISSSWYERDDVATWNYAAVHVHGTARLMGAAELRAHVLAVTERFEGRDGKPVSAESLDKLTPAIVGFEITADRVECAQKMSQSKADDEFARVLAGLDRRGEADDVAVARMMREIRPQG